MKGIIPASTCLFAFALLLTLSACDNVFNRDAKVLYRGQDTGQSLAQCPDSALIEGNSQRLLTEQDILMGARTQLVLEHLVPVIQDELFFTVLHDNEARALASHELSGLKILLCSRGEGEENFQIHEAQGVLDASPQFSVMGLAGKQFMLVLDNRDMRKRFRLDLHYSNREGEPWQPLDKKTAQQSASGFLDMHLHQTGAMAFNQAWYWGSHEIGPLDAMLPDCSGEHASMFEFEHLLDGKVTGPIAYAIAPKHDVDDFMRSHRHMTEAKDYVRSNDRKHQQVAFERLREAHERGLSLVISTVVENNVLLDIMVAAGKGRSDWYPSVMESIKRQIYSLHQIDAASEWFEIVYDPWHARRAINEGKLAVVIGAEFTDVFPLSDGPWRQQLHDLYGMGLRHLQPVHKSDSQFSSTHDQGFPFDHTNLLRALIRKEIPNYPAIQRSLGQSDPSTGLSQAGYDLLDEMVRLHMIIDLSHASLSSQREMTDYLLQEKNHYPFIYSHWSAREPELLDKLKLVGGMIPFGWGQPVPELSGGFEKSNNVVCQDFVRERAELYQRYLDYGIRFSLASDMNGFTSTTQPNFGPAYCQLSEEQKDRSDQTKTWQNMMAQYPEHPDWVNRYWAQGTADISLLPGIVYDLREALGLDTSRLDHSVEDFLQMWERSYDTQRKAFGAL